MVDCEVEPLVVGNVVVDLEIVSIPVRDVVLVGSTAIDLVRLGLTVIEFVMDREGDVDCVAVPLREGDSLAVFDLLCVAVTVREFESLSVVDASSVHVPDELEDAVIDTV